MLADDVIVKLEPVVNPLPKELQQPDVEVVCQPGDKECLTRWISAFSDCD